MPYPTHPVRTYRGRLPPSQIFTPTLPPPPPTLKSFDATLFGGWDFITGLVSYWKLDETSGTRYDSFGTNHLTDTAVTNGVAGIQGNCAQFQKFINNNYLSCTSNSTLQMSSNTDFTIACWVQLASNGVDSSLVTKDDDAANSRDYTLDYSATTGGVGGFRFYIKGGASYIAISGPVVSGSWYFLVGRYDSSVGMCYLNVNSTNFYSGGASGATGTDVSNAEFRIGAREYAANEDYALGYIDEVGIWKRLLTSTEITALYNSGAGVTYGRGLATLTRLPRKSVTATLAPAATISRKLFKGLAAVLSFVGALRKLIVDAGFTATLSFVGNLVTQFTQGVQVFLKSFTATLFQSGGTAATDNFNRANGALGSNWAAIPAHSALTIVSNQCQASATSTFCAQIWDATSFNSDQYSQAVFRTISTSGSEALGLIVRAKTGVDEFYLGFITNTQFQIYIRSGGSYTLKDNQAFTVVTGDVIKLEVIGNQVKLYQNGVERASFLATGGDIITGGKPGILIYDTGHSLSVDDWEGGLTSGVAIASLNRRTGKTLGATLSFVGATTRQVRKTLIATLSFVGSLVRRLGRSFTATLSFIGLLAQIKLLVRVFTGTLSFVGATARQTGKGLTASLSFVGAIRRSFGKVFVATLSFVGVLTKRSVKGLTAVLSFIGLLTQVKLLVRALTATLSFVGALNKRPGKSFSATLNFVGLLRRTLGKTFTATLNFVGALNRGLAKRLTATLTFIGSVGTQLNAGAQVFFQTFAALLTPSGNLVASLTHIGQLFFQAYTATLSFVGTFSRSFSFLKGFVATLQFNLGAGVGYSRTVTIDHTKVPSTQTDFPVLINLTHNDLRTVSNGGHVQNSNGYDIRPYSDLGLTTALTYELERYNATTGEIVMWIKETSLSSSVDTVIYLKYGDSSLTTDGSSTAVWSNSYLGVYHLGDGTTLNVNSSTGSNNGTNLNGVTATTGQVDGAGAFVAASTQRINLGNAIQPGAITHSAWVNATSFPTVRNAVVAKNGGGTSVAFLSARSDGKLRCDYKATTIISYDGTGTYTLATGTWYYLAVTYDSTNGLTGYVNALVDKTVAANGGLVNTGSDTRIGQDPFAGLYWNGKIDEVHIASVARSANWITTEYNNQFSPSTFHTLGAETGVSGAVDPLVFRVNKALAAVLSFTGNLARSLSHIGTLFFKNLLATLSFSGSLVASFSGGVHLFFQNFVANLGFNLVPTSTVTDSYFDPTYTPEQMQVDHEEGQCFTASTSGFAKRVGFYVSQVGTPTGNVVARLWEHTGTFGVDSIPGALLASSDPIAVSTFPTTTGLVYFNFTSAAYKLIVNTHYCVTLFHPDSNLTDYITSAHTVGAFGHHPGIEVDRESESDPWESSDLTDHLFTFEVWDSAPLTTPLTKRVGKRLTGVLNFVGVLGIQFTIGVHLFIQNFVATLNFNTTLTKLTRKFLRATLSFIGLLVRGFVTTWAYYINLRPGEFDPTESELEITKAESGLEHTETESAMTVAEADSILSHTEAESSNFKNVITNDDS